MRTIKIASIILGVMILVLVLSILGGRAWSSRQTANQQNALDGFYTPPEAIPAEPGTIIRAEALSVDVPGAHAYRMLYTSARPDGTPAVSGGMLFIPDGPAPAGGRKVVAWAHGTLGMGDACAPSRSTNPLQDTNNWLDEMIHLGWIVVSTDYVGMGTPGPNLYLVAEAEVADVVNSVRAVRNFPESGAGSSYVVWGHSQGGHSALWSGHLAPAMAPDLTLLGVAAAAPAAELPLIMGAQWNTTVGWVIGPEIVQSWPVVYPQLPLDGYISTEGQAQGKRLAYECIQAAAIEGLARTSLGQEFFLVDPVPTAWGDRAMDQTPRPLPASMPVFIGQSTADTVVLPWPNAVLQEKWCSNGSVIDMLWIGEVSHQDTAMTIGPTAVAWMADRFAGRPATRTCNEPPPVSQPVAVDQG